MQLRISERYIKKQQKYIQKLRRQNILAAIIILVCIVYLVIMHGSISHVSSAAAKQAKTNDAVSDIVKVKNEDKPDEIKDLKAEYEQLKEHNKKLSEDNIMLQNSLRIAAMAGIKPRNYTAPPQITSRGSFDRTRYLGKFKITAYTPSRKECGNNNGITASGKPIIPGVSIAVDKRYWPIGTVFYVKGLGYVTAMDTGSKVKGKNRFDFAVFDRKFAFALGTRKWDVYLVKSGTGKI
jgi:3D (Asp-Asp-Asp) domain-containing protein